MFPASFVILLAAVVTRDPWLKHARSAVSRSWAVTASALTVITGSLGKTTVPSGTANISPLNSRLDK